MKKKVNKPIKSLNKKQVQNAIDENSMLSGIFDAGIYGTNSPLSMPFQLGGDAQYNPITLNRILLSYAYSTFGIIQTFIDTPIEDAFRGGVDIECDELSEDDIQSLQDVLVECKDYKEIKDVMRWAKLFGGGGLIINTDQDPKGDLDYDLIDKNSPLSFIAADRWELTLNYLMSDRIEVPYNYYGQPIHKNRVIKIMGKEAPSFIRQRLQGWGMSELERTMRPMNSYSKNEDVIYELLDEAKIDVWKIERYNTSLMNSNSKAQMDRRFNLATQNKNYHQAIVMDKEDDYEQKQISFSGLAEMQNQNRINIASAVRMPMTKLFGLSASGFNSGEDDLEQYNSLVESEVRGKAHEIVLTVLKLRCQQLFGFIPEHLDIKFKPLRILSGEQMENVKNSKFQRASALYAQGILLPKEYCEQLRKDDIINMDIEVSKGLREPEPPASSLDIDLPQKVVKTKSETAR